MLVVTVTLVVVVIFQTAQCKTGSCNLSLQKDLSQNEPLVLTVIQDNLEWVMPEVVDNQGVISLETGKHLVIACPGSKNNVKANGEETAYIKCDHGSFKIGSKLVAKGGLRCSRSIADSEVWVSQLSCGSGIYKGTMIQLGYQVMEEWLPLVEVCHNISRGVTLYTYHPLPGHSIEGAVKSNQRGNFKIGPSELFPGVSPNTLYTQKRQKEVFKKILGSSSYINGTSFLAKGHLSPDADFIFNSGQLLTYYYVNAAPQWQKFNAGNWISVENAVRRLSAQVDDKLDVYTGTYGVLKLKNNKGQERMIYLEPTKKLIPVPEVFWKLVRHEGSNSCTVVVGYNNVFLTRQPSKICAPVDPSGWPKLTDLRKGYIYYCDYHSFSETVPYVPDLKCEGLLEFPTY